MRILRTKLPGINERLAGQIARVMQGLRRRLAKVPGVAESLDWAAHSSPSTPTTWMPRSCGRRSAAC